VLFNALAAIALIALLASTVLSCGLAMTRATFTRFAQLSVLTGTQAGVSALRTELDRDLRAGGIPSPLPTFAPVATSCAGSCRFITTAHIEIVGYWPQRALAPKCGVTPSNCAIDEERNPFVREGRLAARIAVEVSAPDGAIVAARTSEMIFRLFHEPPYLATAGQRDVSIDAIAPGSLSGDDGSKTTRVRVLIRNATTNAVSDASSWESQPYAPASDRPTGWSP